MNNDNVNDVIIFLEFLLFNLNFKIENFFTKIFSKQFSITINKCIENNNFENFKIILNYIEKFEEKPSDIFFNKIIKFIIYLKDYKINKEEYINYLRQFIL